MTVGQAELSKKIHHAFSGTRYPGDGAIAYDQSGQHLECNAVAAHFRGRNWRNIDTNFLLKEPDAIFFLSPDAYAFFLPAYLLATLEDYRRTDLLPGSIVVSLSPSLSKSPPEEFETQIRALNTQQREAIADWLAFLEKQHGNDFPVNGPRVALDEYWSRYRR